MSDHLDRHDDAATQLDQLLAETVEHARARESSTFADAGGDRATRIVLFGAGGLGRRTLAGLRAAGVEPLAFSDNRSSLWGCSIDDVPVVAPREAAERFGSDAVFVVTIWGAGSEHRLAHSVEQLEALGADLVLPVAWLAWRYAEQLLPFYAMDLPSRLLTQSAEVRRCFTLLADDRSRDEYVSQVRWRLSGDPGGLSHPVPGLQYLVTDVADAVPGDVVLDCGAYDGDTLRSWLAVRGPSFAHYFAMEPDPESRSRLERCVAELPSDVAAKVEILPYSVAGYTGTATFAASGSLSSSLGDDAGLVVDCITFDDLEARLGGAVPTFVKVDIEGAELDALEGGREFLGRERPMIAIASYHRQDHLWRVPLAVHDIWQEYRLFLRPHNEEAWDLVLYAVPPDRVPSG